MLLKSLIKVVDSIVKCRHSNRFCVGNEAQADATSMGLIPPLHILFAASFLWSDVREELVVSRLIVNADAF